MLGSIPYISAYFNLNLFIMKKTLLRRIFFVLSLLICSTAWAQERTVTGRVTSAEDGTGLPGVNVVIKGTTLGTVTDGDGNFSINASSGSTIVVSFIGFTSQEVLLENQQQINFSLQSDIKQLSEVIVTGYGAQQDKRSLTGSVSSVSGKVFENLPLQSADRAIQGRLSGVQVAAASGQPGGALNVRVRGIGSINASNDPLWIIDGVQVARFGGTTQGSSNPLASINPNDIESIDVLKDAASAAIYGAQAANGVVIVTTKKGKKGAPKIDISVQEGIVQPLKQYEVLNGLQFATLRAEAYTNAGLNPAAAGNAYELYGNPNDAANVNDYNWIDALYRTARLSTYDATISGGDERTTYLLSGSFQKQEGQILNSDWKRGTVRLNVTTKATDKLTIGANIALSYQRTFGTISNGNFVNGPFSASYTLQPTSPGVDPVTGKYNVYPLRGAHNFGYNVLQGINEEVRLGRTASTVSNLTATYQIMPGLTFNALAGIDFQTNRDDNQRPATIPVFASDRGQVTITNRRTINFNTNSTLNYSKKFNEVHSVAAIVGYEYKEENREIISGAQFGYSNPFFRLLSQGSTARPATESFFDYRRQGFFGQVKYGYSDKYLADFTLRRDGSSRFGALKRYGTFYAGSVAWRIKNESFLKSVDFIDDLKFRVSYGVVGNSEIGNYDGLSQYGTNPTNVGQLGAQQGSYLGQGILRPTRLGNDLLTWEEEVQKSVGVDYALFGNRLYGSVEYYENTTNAQLFSVPLPTDAGFANVQGNAGSVLNKGFDIELGAKILSVADFKWSGSVNFSTLTNRVTELPRGLDRIGSVPQNGGIAGNGISFLIKGQPVAFHYLAEYAGVNPANGKAMVYDTLGNLSYQPTVRDLAVRGSSIPTYFGGITNNFSYKGLSLEVFFQFQGGNKGFNGDLYNLANSGSDVDNQLVTQLDRWQKPGDITNVPRAFQGGGGVVDGFDQQFGTLGSTRFLSDATYMRLKQVTLSYNIPASILSKIKMRSLTVFTQGINLLTWTKFDGLDPEVVANNNSTNASSFGTFPNAKQYTVGLSIGL